MNTTYPPLFGRWDGPWVLVTVESIDDAWQQWVRPYREESHCDTVGCCETSTVVLGPHPT